MCIFDDDPTIFFGFGSPHSGSEPQKSESGQGLPYSIGLDLSHRFPSLMA
jgi:hypothetical protein